MRAGPRRSVEREVEARDRTPRPGQGRKAPAASQPLTAERIRAVAEAYVAQRESSAAMLRQVLERRLLRRLRTLEPEAAAEERKATLPLIEAEVERLVLDGVVQDGRYAEMKARSGLSSGRGVRRILRDLGRKGIADATARGALLGAAADLVGVEGEVEPGDILPAAEAEAAEIFARKRRLGPYRDVPLPDDWSERSKIWRREASAMVRAGFGADTIRRVLDQEPEQDD